ncbi:MAG TPA: hypothetical protein VMC10_19040 [Stellaceae bacterium]|nr:hypothetical protein [Stellaceae bacterium]
MGTPYRGRSAELGGAAFPEFSQFCTMVSRADIAIAWAAVLVALGGMVLLSGLG